MGREDWYRRPTWTSDDEAAFFARLKRSHGVFHKAQYLRIQALHLQENGYYAEALRLLRIARAEYPEDSQATRTFTAIAECLCAIGDMPEGFDAYMQALQWQKRVPNVISAVALSFAENFCDYDGGVYRETLMRELSEEIERFSAAGAVPYLKFRYCCIMARLLVGLNAAEEAVKWANTAIGIREAANLDAPSVVENIELLKRISPGI